MAKQGAELCLAVWLDLEPHFQEQIMALSTLLDRGVSVESIILNLDKNKKRSRSEDRERYEK